MGIVERGILGVTNMFISFLNFLGYMFDPAFQKIYEFWLDIRWELPFFMLAAVILAVLVIFVLNRIIHRRKIIINDAAWFGAIFLVAFFYFLPYYARIFKGLQVFLLSVQHVFRLFAIDGDFEAFYDILSGRQTGLILCPPEFLSKYTTLGTFLYILAPLMTFKFILSFFKNLAAKTKYFFSFFHPIHVFSELNDKTLALARNIRKRTWKDVIVFTDIIDKKEEVSLELIDAAKGLDAILYRADLDVVKLRGFFKCLRKLNFYLVSQDEAEKVRHATNIIKRYDKKRVTLRIFSDDIRTELFIAAAKVKKMQLHRVNDVQALIYHSLDENGIKLFDRARMDKDGKNVISVVIVGFGKYGQEMLKALTWYCQYKDFECQYNDIKCQDKDFKCRYKDSCQHKEYKLKITVFENDENAESKFKAQCPELMSEKYNGREIKGEPYYEIKINPGINTATEEFEQKLSLIEDATYIFVCLGDDRENLSVAEKIRTICEGIKYSGDGHKPDIETVIYDSALAKKLRISWGNVENKPVEANGREKYEGVTNFRNKPYNILMIGDLENFYSEDTVINSELEEAGRRVNRSYLIDPARVEFAEENLTGKWTEFLVNHKIEADWKAFIQKREKTENESLGEQKSEFFFKYLEHEKDNKKIKEETKRLIDEWGETLSDWFNKEMWKDKKLLKKWRRIEKENIKAADEAFRYEYSYRSSVTKAIHKRLIEKMKNRNKETAPEKKPNFFVKQFDKIRNKLDKKFGPVKKFARKVCLCVIRKPEKPETWTYVKIDKKIETGMVEHVRWNAYMRTEGYSYAPERNDLAKCHQLLIPVSELTDNELRKDG